MISRFELDFHAATTRRANGLAGRVFGGSVIVRISIFPRNVVRISLIQTLPLFRCAGNASLALDFLCDLADDYGLTLILTPYALDLEDSRTLDTSQLIKWYERRGFVEINNDDMARYPKGGMRVHNKESHRGTYN